MTPTLSQFPLRRLAALLRRAPFWAQALALCALFAITGTAVLDDYGVTGDEATQHETATIVADYALGVSEELPIGDDLYYGVAFEMPLLLIERALGLQDSRHIYLTRHLLTHLFFIAGGFACAMLAYRMLGSRWIALLAMLLFLLHPRLYAHSFFNTKDIPFAALTLISLYLAHRAFRKDAIGAFMLCGVGVGLAIDLRPFALMLPPMIIAMCALDFWQASDWAERKRIIASAGVFLATALAVVYIIHPHYWENPLRFIEGLRLLSQHPTIVANLFMGEIHWSDAVPWNYIPVWFAITAPPVALALGAIGCAAVCWQAISRPLAALRCREIRFRIMLFACVALPVAAAIALQSNIYNGWRHMYFLWAPFCLLAAAGLHQVANIRIEAAGVRKAGARLPGWIRGSALRRTLAYGVAAVGLITTLTAMAALHPNQQVYFNALVDTKTPGALGKRYDMDYYLVAQRQSLEYMLARYPDDALHVRRSGFSRRILPQDDRERILTSRNLNSADYYLPDPNRLNSTNATWGPTLYRIEAYGSAIAIIVAPKNVEAYRAAYHDVAANGTPLVRADFDIYIHNGALHYLSADCDTLKKLKLLIFLNIFPATLSDLPAYSRELGFEIIDYKLTQRAAFFDGKCIITQPLPSYPIVRIATGYESKETEWRVDIDLAARAAQALRKRIAAGDYGQLVAQSDFAVYLRDNTLTYFKSLCAPGDADARFLLHIIPANPTDLPASGREYGYENLNFQFADYGGRAGDICVAERELPDYPIDRIRTGQFVSGAGWLWNAEFPAAR